MIRALFVYYGTLGLAGGYIDGLLRAAEHIADLDCSVAVSAYYRFPARRSRLLRIFFPITERTPENPVAGLTRRRALRLPLRYLEICAAYAFLLLYVVVRRIDLVNVSLTDDYLLTVWFLRCLQRLGVRVHVTAHDSTPFGGSVPGRRHGVYAMAERVVVHYDHVRDNLVRDYGVAADRITVCAYPAADPSEILDRALFDRHVGAAQVRSQGVRRTMLFIGVLRPEKGLADLVAAWIRRHPAPSPDERLVVAGRSPSGVAWRGPGRPDIVVVAHYLDSEEFAAWVHVSDVVVLPYSLRSYSHSAVLLMAWLAERPVLASDIPLFANLVTTDAGYLFRAGDVDDLATVLRHISAEADASLLEKGRMGRRRVLKSWDALSGQLATLLGAQTPRGDVVASFDAAQDGRDDGL